MFTGEEGSLAAVRFRGLLYRNYQGSILFITALAGFQKHVTFFFQIAEPKEHCKDLRNAFPSMCLGISIVQLYEKE